MKHDASTVSLVLVVLGVVGLLAEWRQWSWYVNSPRHQFMISLVGKPTTSALHLAISVAFICAGVAIAVGMLRIG